MTETEKVNAYELSEYGRELLWRTAYRVTYQRMELAWYEGVLHSAVKRLSASIEESKKNAQDDSERLRLLESDEVLLETLKKAYQIATEINHKDHRLSSLADRLNDTILDCARRGWINGNDIRDIERVGFDL